MLSVLLTDLAHWRYLLTADRLLLLVLTIAAADYFHLRQSPPFQLSYCWLTPTWDCIKSQYFLEISESFPKRNLASKYYLVKVTFSLCNDWQISVLSCHHHALEGEILWCIIDSVGIFGNANYGCLLLRFSSDCPTLLLTLRWPSFCILYFLPLRVGICGYLFLVFSPAGRCSWP